jgi:hypothetical protein
MSNLMIQGFLAFVVGYLSTGTLTGAVVLIAIYCYILNHMGEKGSKQKE